MQLTPGKVRAQTGILQENAGTRLMEASFAANLRDLKPRVHAANIARRAISGQTLAS
jgi:hypothetical protein